MASQPCTLQLWGGGHTAVVRQLLDAGADAGAAESGALTTPALACFLQHWRARPSPTDRRTTGSRRRSSMAVARAGDDSSGGADDVRRVQLVNALCLCVCLGLVDAPRWWSCRQSGGGVTGRVYTCSPLNACNSVKSQLSRCRLHRPNSFSSFTFPFTYAPVPNKTLQQHRTACHQPHNQLTAPPQQQKNMQRAATQAPSSSVSEHHGCRGVCCTAGLQL